jgi:hypothetical protein
MRLSYKRIVDGVWVGVLGGNKSDDGLIRNVSEALKLIQQYDPVRYRRLLRDVKRIWIHTLVGARGQFNFAFKRCSLDLRFVESAPIETIASTIVHEATHGHPCLTKMGYPEGLRSRIENICMQQQLAFVRKLPAATSAEDDVKRNLTREPSFWSDKARNERRPDQELEALRSLGVPDWITKSFQAVRRMQGRFHRR